MDDCLKNQLEVRLMKIADVSTDLLLLTVVTYTKRLHFDVAKASQINDKQSGCVRK